VTTSPSNTSTASIYLSNWRDLVGCWQGTRLTRNAPRQAPGIRELRFLGGPRSSWAVNQIVDHGGFFRDETRGIVYTDTTLFTTAAWFASDRDRTGVLRTEYTRYQGPEDPPDWTVVRSHAAVPGEPLLVVEYAFTNTSGAARRLSLLDQVHLRSLGAAHPRRAIRAWHDAGRRALFADFSESEPLVITLGAFGSVDGHQVADDSDRDPSHATASGWTCFKETGELPRNDEVTAPDVSLAFHKALNVPPDGTVTQGFYLTAGRTVGDGQAAADTAAALDSGSWFARTSAAHESWLAGGGQGKQVSFADAGLNVAFKRELIVIKNAQNPVLGTFPAATNPVSYGHNNWVRDSCITAVALDAAGHHDEARQYWEWMAAVQGDDGTWKTRYGVWRGEHSPFVEPEYDSVGQFLYGVCQHFRATGDMALLQRLWPAVRRGADWILSHIAPSGLGAADCSIWEETTYGLEHNSFTQAWYVAGLYSAQYLAETRGDTGLSDWYSGGAGAILTALNRSAAADPPGMWNEAGYFNRAVKATGAPLDIVDSSSLALLAFGAVDPGSDRARRHLATVLARLTHDDHGLARYPNDRFYFDSGWDPGGNEADEPEPSWPQMSMWAALAETAAGEPQQALERLEWFVETSGAGYMPHGEAVNNRERTPAVSTMCEPITAASFVIAALALAGRHQVLVLPPIVQAGTHAQIGVRAAAADAARRWARVPYFVGWDRVAGVAGATRIGRVAIANDAGHLYVRVDNTSGSLPRYDTAPLFALRLYSGDLSHRGAPAAPWGLERQTIPRPMRFLVERRSDESGVRTWEFDGALWQPREGAFDGAAIEWDPDAGLIEAAIPLDALASAGPAAGDNWTTMIVTLAHHDAPSSWWRQDGRLVILYRLSSGGQPAICGQLER
jgi:hypothetical protein